MDTLDLDKLVRDYKHARDMSDEWDTRVTELKLQLLDALETTGKHKYYVEGVGTISQVVKTMVATPKTKEAKNNFFQYIAKQYGEEVMWEYMGVNSRSLNSFYKEEAAKIDGPEEFRLPGIDPPETRVTLSLRKG